VKWGAVYRNDEALTAWTHALGWIDIPAGFQWQVGAGWFVLPDALVSEALKNAACVHDRAYRDPWTAEHLRRADRAFVEVYWRAGGSPWLIPLLWTALRFWAWKRAGFTSSV